MKMIQHQEVNPSLFAKQSMKQAFLILTLPVDELGSYLQQELEQNPLFNWEDNTGDPQHHEKPIEDLTFSDNDYSYLNHWEELRYVVEDFQEKQTKIVPFIETSFEELMRQFQEYTEDKDLIEAGRDILGNLDSRGLLTSVKLDSPTHRKALAIIKNLEPKGLASKTLQEAFLEQLKHSNETARLIVDKYWKELNAGDFKTIESKVKLDKKAVLNLLRDHLVLPYLENDRHLMAPVPSWDLSIVEEIDRFDVKVNDEILQKFTLNLEYYNQSSSFIEKMKSNLKWVLKNLQTRIDLLQRLGQLILKANQSLFKSSGARVVTLNVQEVADQLSIHPSTLYRMIKDKWINTPKGLFPLKNFFNLSVHIEDTLRSLIQQEDPKNPYTDEQLSVLLAKEGYELSRRAVSKYRKQLNILSSRTRR